MPSQSPKYVVPRSNRNLKTCGGAEAPILQLDSSLVILENTMRITSPLPHIHTHHSIISYSSHFIMTFQCTSVVKFGNFRHLFDKV